VNYGSKENPISPAQATPAQHPAMLSRQVVWHWTTAAALVVAYVALEWISFIHESKGLPLTPGIPALGSPSLVWCSAGRNSELRCLSG
jgi:hypothetical protein